MKQTSPTISPVAPRFVPQDTVLLASTSAVVAPSGGASGTQSVLGKIVRVYRLDSDVRFEFRVAERAHVCRVFTRTTHRGQVTVKHLIVYYQYVIDLTLVANAIELS